MVAAGDGNKLGAEQTRERLRRGALLVCAYENEQQCRNAGIEGALTLQELEHRLPGLPKTQELIFFCG